MFYRGYHETPTKGIAVNNRKFYFGLFLMVAGTAGVSAVLTLFIKDKLDARRKNENPTVTLTSKELFAHLYAIKSVVEKADNGGYDNVLDQQAAMQSDFEFFKIEFMES